MFLSNMVYNRAHGSPVRGAGEHRVWPLSIFPHRRQLFADGRPITLGGRAFDVLMTLIEASGAVVSKDELLKRVWQGRIVEENRLAGEITALRKAFGADRELIRTVAGRGYQFTGEIRLRSSAASDQEVSDAAAAVASPMTTAGSGSPRPDKPSIAVLPFTQFERRPGAGILRRRHGRGDYHSAQPDQMAVRYRPQFQLHLQGPGRRC
jgi:DNA-binding winged helix-turn-helix (wHTH) protein